MKEKVLVKDLIKFNLGEETDFRNEDYYLDDLDICCDFITEKYGRAVDQEVSDFVRKGKYVEIEYEFDEELERLGGDQEDYGKENK